MFIKKYHCIIYYPKILNAIVVFLFFSYSKYLFKKNIFQPCVQDLYFYYFKTKHYYKYLLELFWILIFSIKYILKYLFMAGDN